MSPYRYDVTNRSRYIYLQLLLDSKPVGNLVVPALPGAVMFARLPLSAGSDSVTFFNSKENVAAAIVKLSPPLSRIASIRFKVFNSQGQLFDFQNVNWGTSMLFRTA